MNRPALPRRWAATRPVAAEQETQANNEYKCGREVQQHAGVDAPCLHETQAIQDFNAQVAGEKAANERKVSNAIHLSFKVAAANRAAWPSWVHEILRMRQPAGDGREQYRSANHRETAGRASETRHFRQSFLAPNIETTRVNLADAALGDNDTQCRSRSYAGRHRPDQAVVAVVIVAVVAFGVVAFVIFIILIVVVVLVLVPPRGDVLFRQSGSPHAIEVSIR